ncbi:hypothetical protein [Roseicitreum antarcticum]|nr:hypothetical protein [Roseicitreum antarcticum]
MPSWHASDMVLSFGRGTARRVMRRAALTLGLVGALAALGAAPRANNAAQAQTVQGAMSVPGGQTRVARDGTIIVERDNGGLLIDRIRYLGALRQSGQRVEIRGQCISACTLYLGLPQTCVSPDTIMGFHGPQSRLYGIALPPADFEYWSRVMADHYPPALKRWFLAEGRNEIMGVRQIRGSELIRLGARECA